MLDCFQKQEILSSGRVRCSSNRAIGGRAIAASQFIDTRIISRRVFPPVSADSVLVFLAQRPPSYAPDADNATLDFNRPWKAPKTGDALSRVTRSMIKDKFSLHRYGQWQKVTMQWAWV